MKSPMALWCALAVEKTGSRTLLLQDMVSNSFPGNIGKVSDPRFSHAESADESSFVGR